MRFSCFILACLAAPAVAADPPRIVGVPPVDAGRGLVRISETEIRHYPGVGGSHYLRSADNGETWAEVELPADYPGATCLEKESPSFTRSPHNGEFLRVLLTCGQHPLHRRLMILDLRWLYEKERRSDLSTDGTRDWSTHQFIDKIAGHCGYNRKPGAQVEGGALRVRRVADDSLTNPNQGATWNFPTGQSGTIHARIRLEPGGAGVQIALTDRWFNPTDPTVDRFAGYLLKIDAEGRSPDGKALLSPGKTHKLSLAWNDAGRKGPAGVMIDGKDTGIILPCLNACPNGISYIHFYNPAAATDPHGFSIFNTLARIEPP